ncbi:MAG: TfoX/Sxy family protein [Solirubrobacteraceae bacterium]
MAYDAELAQRVRELLLFEPDVAEKRMFGGLSFLISGHIAVAVSRSGGLLMRAERDEREQLLALPDVEPWVMRGRQLQDWVRVGEEAVADDADLKRWVQTGVGLARALPPKL